MNYHIMNLWASGWIIGIGFTLLVLNPKESKWQVVACVLVGIISLLIGVGMI